jgi:hypothetical protein
MLGEATYMPQRTGRVEDKEMDRARLERLRLSGEDVVPARIFELAARIGEYTKKEKRGTDCYRTDDLTFAVVTASGSVNVAGSGWPSYRARKRGRGTAR